MAPICSDPEVMRFLSASRDRETTRARIGAWSAHISEFGWGFWAAELKEAKELIGFVGMAHLAEDHPFAPGVELGWRLARKHWGKGYATEGGLACLEVAFDSLGLPELIATTAVPNVKSSSVMRRLGMQGPELVFEHPGVPAASPLKSHLLYRISRSQWLGYES